MKITVISEKGHLHAIADRMLYEGDEVELCTHPPNKYNSPDLILTDTRLKGSFTCPVVGGDELLPSQVTKAMFENTCPNPSPFYYFSKWFDSYNGFSPQTLVCFPVYGMMNHDLGHPVPTGIGLRYIENPPSEFSNVQLLKVLKAMKHNGFVSLSFNKTGSIAGVYTYMPLNGLLAALEGAPSRISEFFAEPCLLRQSWVIGILLTVYPYPFQSRLPERMFVDIHDDIRKHLWLSNMKHTSSGSYTDSSVVGFSTAWHPHLSNANRRAVRTCNALQDVKEKQYRTDLSTICQAKWVVYLDHHESIQSSQSSVCLSNHEPET